MSKIVWDKTGERYLESGVSHGVLYTTVPDKVVVTKNLGLPQYKSAKLTVDSADLYSYDEGNRAQIKMNVTDPCKLFPQYRSHHNGEGTTGTFKYAYVTVKNKTPVDTAQTVASNVGATASGNNEYSIGEYTSEKSGQFNSISARIQTTTLFDNYDMGVLKDQWVVTGWATFTFSSGTSAGTVPYEIAQVDELYFYSEGGLDYMKAFVNAAVENPDSLPLGSGEYWSVGASSSTAASKYVDATLFTDSPGVFTTPEKRTEDVYLIMYTGDIVEETVRVPSSVAWNGLISISASPEGAEDNDQWADNMKYSRTKSKETWGGSIEAYQSPKEFDACDGSAEAVDGVNVGQQKRESFGLCYRTEIMNDASGGESCGYLLHLLYNLTASPSERSYETINDSPDAMTLSWELDGVPVNVDGYEPLTEITIDSRYADAEKLAELEGMLFGTDESDAYQPSPKDVIDLFVTT